MKQIFSIILAVSIFATSAHAQDADKDEAQDSDVTEPVKDETPAKPGGPKTLSGMSILGNEETPKSLVIVPWKSSEMGDELSLSDTLDDRAQPVDKEVFLRELQFYRIRAGNE